MNVSGQFPDLLGPKQLPSLAQRLTASGSGSPKKKPKPKKRKKRSDGWDDA